MGYKSNIFQPILLLMWYITLLLFTWCHVRLAWGLAASHTSYMGGWLYSAFLHGNSNGQRQEKAKPREIQSYQKSQSNRSLIHPSHPVTYRRKSLWSMAIQYLLHANCETADIPGNNPCPWQVHGRAIPKGSSWANVDRKMPMSFKGGAGYYLGRLVPGQH